MSRRKQVEAVSAPLPPALHTKLLGLGARIITGDIGELEALDILEAVALNAPMRSAPTKAGRAA
nr:hypothetical protein [uncultured Acidocella sp.]